MTKPRASNFRRTLRVVLVFVAALFAVGGVATWNSHQSLQADLRLLESYGAVTEWPKHSGPTTFSQVNAYWLGVDEGKRAEYVELCEDPDMARSAEVKQIIRDLEPLFLLMTDATNQEQLFWDNQDVELIDQYPVLARARAIARASEGDASGALETIRMMRRMVYQFRKAGGLQGHAWSLLVQLRLNEAAASAGIAQPTKRVFIADLLKELETERTDVATLLRQEVAASRDLCWGSEWLDYAEGAELPSQIPEKLQKIIVSSRFIKRQTERKLLDAWIQVIPRLKGTESEIEALIQNQGLEMKKDKSISGSIASTYWFGLEYLVSAENQFRGFFDDERSKLRKLLQ